MGTRQALHRELTIDLGHDHGAVPRRGGLIDCQHVAGHNARPGHRLAFDAQKERRQGTPHQMLVEVEPPLTVVIGR